MADAADLERLARQHMVLQVRKASATQVALARYWDRMVDPNDFARTFAQFREVAVPLILAARSAGESAADGYYASLLDLEDLPRGKQPPHEPLSPGAIRSSLSGATKADNTAWRLAQDGANPQALMNGAKAAMLRSAKRQILNASRDRLIARRKVDPNVRGWARVSDGNPCGFCAMLVSRGPVYDEQTVRFHAHDGCGCSVRLVTYKDPSGGWTDDARAHRQLWDLTGNLTDFRYALEHPEWAAKFLTVKPEDLALAA